MLTTSEPTQPPATAPAVPATEPARPPTEPPTPQATEPVGPPPRAPFEFTAQISAGGGALFAPGQPVSGVFALGWRADMLFLRNSPRAFGLGPALAVRVDHFRDVVPSLGLSVLLPVTEAFPVVLTGAFAMRYDGTSWAPGGSARAWFGMRSHNYHSVYALCFGLWAEARVMAQPQSTVDFVAGIDLDLQTLAIPFIALYVELFRRTPAH